MNFFEEEIMESIRWGICGAGKIAHTFADTLRKTGRKLYAIASSNIDRAKIFAKEEGAEKYYSYEDMANDSKVDAVYIATNHTDHMKSSIIYLNSNIPVLCEKPMSINYDYAKIMSKTALANNTLLMEAMWTKFLPATNKLKEIIEDGIIGDIINIECNFCVNVKDFSSRAFNSMLAGGALLDLGIYTYNYVKWLIGDYNIIQSTAYINKYNVDETDLIILKSIEGVTVSLKNSIAFEAPIECTIIGREGKIIVPHFLSADKIIIENAQGKNEINYPHDATGYEYEIKHFEELIKLKKNESNIMKHSDTLDTLRVFDGLRKQWGLNFDCEK